MIGSVLVCIVISLSARRRGVTRGQPRWIKFGRRAFAQIVTELHNAELGE
jgi:hypothetical protein